MKIPASRTYHGISVWRTGNGGSSIFQNEPRISANPVAVEATIIMPSSNVSRRVGSMINQPLLRYGRARDAEPGPVPLRGNESLDPLPHVKRCVTRVLNTPAMGDRQRRHSAGLVTIAIDARCSRAARRVSSDPSPTGWRLALVQSRAPGRRSPAGPRRGPSHLVFVKVSGHVPPGCVQSPVISPFF
jgi:hypothetical protein